MKHTVCLLSLLALSAFFLMVGCTHVGTNTESEDESMRESETVLTSADETEPETTETESETETSTETETEADIPATISFDKTEYRVAEEIFLTVTGNAGDTVGFFPADFDVTVKSPIYYAVLGEEHGPTQGTPIAVTELPGQNRNNPNVAFYYGVLPVGDYKAVVIGDDGVRAEATLTIVYGTDAVTTGAELAARCIDVARNYKTLYVNGCFGAPMTESNKQRYTQNTSYNRRPERTSLINAASADTFGFDCVCFIKGILWGWNGNLSHVYGGANYQANGVPDITENSMIERSADVTTDFSAIEVGEAVWLDGHIGIYIGNGLAVECTPSWQDGVQITACNTNRRGFQRRNWTRHGRLPYVTYGGEREIVNS